MMEIDTNISKLISYVKDEYHVEILVNKDTSGFWALLSEHVFKNTLVSFKESIRNFQAIIAGDKDAYSYMTAMFTNIFALPFIEQALLDLTKSFDRISENPFMGDGLGWKCSDLGSVEKFLLFLCIFKSSITYETYLKQQAINAEIRNASAKRGSK